MKRLWVTMILLLIAWTFLAGMFIAACERWLPDSSEDDWPPSGVFVAFLVSPLWWRSFTRIEKWFERRRAEEKQRTARQDQIPGDDLIGGDR